MTELVTFDAGRVLSIPGQQWAQSPPLEIQHLRRDVCRQMRRIDALLRELGLVALLMPQPDSPTDAVCRLGGTAYR